MTEAAPHRATIADAHDMPLSGRHALVTGGSRGIGAACGRALAELGARVTLVARNSRRLADTANALGKEVGTEVRPLALDVTDQAALVAGLDAAAAAAGPIDILVNNAGGTDSAPIERLDDGNWAATLELNLTSAFVACRAVIPAMKENGFGRIVNVASTAGLRGYAYVAAYCAAKHGLIGLTRALAIELATTEVTVNAVCPGYTDTEMSRASVERIVAATGRSVDEARAALTKFNPQGRLIAPQEIAAAVAFLCCPGAGAITGTALPIAGGEVT